MRNLNIKEKLEELDVTLDAIVLGDFDVIGEYTAKRNRSPNDTLYKKVGAFYRSNYERGILIYYLIKQHRLNSMLEIGFGRGYATLCAAKAFHDMGIDGTITTIDPTFDEQFLNALTKIFPPEWFKMIKFVKGASQAVLPTLTEQFDLVYIDGDHSYEATKFDWEHTKEKYKKFLLFDDYHMPSKDDAGIRCAQLIDEIDDPTKELIIMDRVIFENDKKLRPEDIDYGQVLLTRA